MMHDIDFPFFLSFSYFWFVFPGTDRKYRILRRTAVPSVFCPAPGLPNPQLQRKELRETRKVQALSRSEEEDTGVKERLYFETKKHL